jgi:bacterioferritin-associated ferredoxin
VPPVTGLVDDEKLICHCRQVSYRVVERAIESGAHSLVEVQRGTTACTRCFGCRFEVEGLLRERLGARYVETEFITRGASGETGRRSRFRLFRRAVESLPRRMYMPALLDYGDAPVDTRVVAFHWAEGHAAPVELRADLLALDGRRSAVRKAVVAPGASVVFDVREMAGGDRLTAGAGIVKLVVDADDLGSLRPYFQFVSSGGITSTHEKAGPSHPSEFGHRPFFWSFPVGFTRVPQDAYFFYVNTQERPMRRQELVWRTVAGAETAISLPEAGLDQGAFVPLHEHAPEIRRGDVAGTVRLSPPEHKVAGFMVRYDPAGDRWRVQHL